MVFRINVTRLGDRISASSRQAIKTKVLKSHHAAMAQAHREATRAFIDAMLDNMLVDTGMSRGSLLPLAAAVRHKSAIRARLSGKGPRIRRNSPTGRFADNNTRFVSIAAGERLGQEGKGFEFSVGTPQKLEMTLIFRITVLQHFLWENGLQSQGGVALNSLEAGRTAYVKTFLPAFRRIRPSIADQLVGRA